jgi:hypothetical protein
MNILLDKHKQIVIELLEEKVDFILVGGYAVIYHGYGRITGDMDVWLKPDNENKLKLIKVLQKNNISKEGLEKIKNTDFTEVVVFHIGKPPEKVEFLTKIGGVNFDEAFSHRTFFQLKEHHVPVLHLNDLIANKLLSNRLKDKADVEELQKIHQLKKK